VAWRCLRADCQARPFEDGCGVCDARSAVYELREIGERFTMNMKTNYKFELHCGAGVYYANSLFDLIVQVLRHRWWHLMHDGKWMD
jgi:hypothetical protein